jgi:hypothetical protein
LEAEVMASERDTKEESPGAFDLDVTDPLAEAMSAAEQGQAALDQLRTMVEETTARLEELSRANAVFEAVADRLVATTLKASESATRGGDSAQAASVALVEELAELARRSLIASGNGRCQLREHEKTALSSKVAAHQANAALDALSSLLKQLAEGPTVTAVIPPIEVETRPPPPPKEATTNWAALLAPSKPSRYKN